jgi:hypothetical protein
MADEPMGDCDFCQQPLGERGWMVPAGETLRLEEDGPLLPVYKFYCSEICLEKSRA